MREDYQRVYAEVNLNAICTNVQHMKDNISPNTKIIGVIKADGYGHGAIPIAKELDSIDYMMGFAVATAEEAFILRKSGIQKPLLVLGYTFPYSYEKMILENIRITVFRYDTLIQIQKTVQELEKQGIYTKAKIHIKVDTGMSRIGIQPDLEGLNFVSEVLEMKELEAEGIFTHFACADEADKTSAQKQLCKFKNFMTLIKEKTGKEIPIKHCSNSAGIVELPDANMDAVRAGIILYGLWPSEQVSRNNVELTPVLSLYSHIVYLKEIEAGTPVSYGSTFVADHRMRIATIPVGYGDGYPRGLSGKGYVLLHGQKAPILGRICMDQFMIDVTEIEGSSEGDLVTLIGKDDDCLITMEQLGNISGRFNYELACDLGKRIPRVYKKDGKILSVKDYYEDF